jgi:general secretion pathway protein H
MTPISEDSLSRHRQCAKSQQGFTLLELLVVLSIIILASAVVIPSINSTDNSLLTAQVRQTASAFNYARRMAIVEGAPQLATILQMDPDDPDYPEIKGEILQRAGAPLLEGLDVRVTYQADINDVAEELDVIELIFYPQGGSTGGIISFTLEDITAWIQVDPITGRIHTYYPGDELPETIY